MPINQDPSSLLDKLFWEPNLLIPGNKPNGAIELDRNNPFVQGLVGGWFFIKGRIYEIQTKPIIGGGYSTTINLKGHSGKTDGVSAGVYQNNDINLSSWDKTTLAVRGNFTTPGSFGPIAGLGGQTSTPKMMISQSSSATNRYAFDMHSQTLSYANYTQFNSGYLEFFLIERSATDREVFCGEHDKPLESLWANATAVSYFTRTNAALGSAPNNWTSSPTVHEGPTEWDYMLWWDRTLSISEMQQFHYNPYQVLKPKQFYATFLPEVAPPTGIPNDIYYKTLLSAGNF